MVIFHSYVSLPDVIVDMRHIRHRQYVINMAVSQATGFTGRFTGQSTHLQIYTVFRHNHMVNICFVLLVGNDMLIFFDETLSRERRPGIVAQPPSTYRYDTT